MTKEEIIYYLQDMKTRFKDDVVVVFSKYTEALDEAIKIIKEEDNNAINRD